jgi:hypothetical protein
MTIFGFRSDPNTPRYAIVDASGAAFTILNATTENRLCFPADCIDETAQLTWLFREFGRIFHANPDIARTVIKVGEFTQSDNKAKRFSSYQEAALSLYCGMHSIPVSTKLYASLATRSAQVREHAINRVGQTARYWDNKMADAVMAAWWGATNP